MDILSNLMLPDAPDDTGNNLFHNFIPQFCTFWRCDLDEKVLTRSSEYLYENLSSLRETR